MGKITRKRRSRSSKPPAVVGDNKLPTRCQKCGGELRLDLQLGKYTVMKCDPCNLCYRHFPPEPLAVFLDEEE